MGRQKKIFLAGIDSDTTNQYLKEGSDRYRLNVRVLSSETGNLGAIETVNGNTLVSFTLPAGTNKVIGSKEDPLQQKIYYFLYNSNTDHSILEYDSVAGTISFVLTHADLNFQEDFLITGINVMKLDEDSHLLYWTDGFINPADTDEFNEPRKINIEKGKAFMLGDYVTGYKFPFDSEILFAIKQPPQCPPTYTWSGIDLNVPNFQANNTASTTVALGGSPVAFQIPFNTPYLNVGNNYNPVTSAWTVPTDGNYAVTAGVNFNYSGNTIDTRVFVLGVRVSGRLTTFQVSTTLQFRVNGVTVDSAFVGLNAGGNFTGSAIKYISLNSGDVVTIWAQYSGSLGTVVSTGTIFSANDVIETLDNINHLFKKLYKFKARFTYDDYEKSAWSPISNYVLPVTTGNTLSGEDILLQDNTITINVPTGNSIVTKIELAAQEINQVNFYKIAELDKAELNIQDNALYPYVFTNEVIGVPIDEKESNKLFDRVPLVAPAQDIIQGERIVYGNVTEGFDPVDIDMRLILSYEEVTTHLNSFFPAVQYLKTGGLYEYGVVYYDHANRSGLTNVKKGKSTLLLPDGTYGTSLYVPFLTESSYDPVTLGGSMSRVPAVNAEIYNSPPSWATHYQIVRSKNKTTDSYIQFNVQGVSYIDESGAVVSSGTATRLNVDIGNIIGRYLTENPLSNLVYDWTKGDRIRFIAQPTGPTGTYTAIHDFIPFNDTEILSFDSGTQVVSIFLDTNNSMLRNADGVGIIPGCMVEIYNPKPTVSEESEVMYEIGECYDIIDFNGDRVHQGTLATQSSYDFFDNYFDAGFTGFQVLGTSGFSVGDKIKIAQDPGATHLGYNTYATVTRIDTSATGQIIITDIVWLGNSPVNSGVMTRAAVVRLSGGDSFRRYQNMPFVTGGVVKRLYSYIESMNVSDMFVSNATDYGRPNRIDDDFKRITRPSTIYYSEKAVSETFINGLNAFSDVNFETYDQDYGGIYKLYGEEGTLWMGQESKIGVIPVERIIYNDLQNNNAVGASQTVLSPQVIYRKGEFGIGKHAESFAVYGGAKYGIDVKRGVLWRDSNDGLTPISDIYSMHNYFTDKCASVLGSTSKVNICGVYDIRYKEYIVCFGDYSSGGVAVVGETVAFNEKANQFSTFYSYVPESIVNNGVNIISFKSGGLYTHDTNILRGNFYGVQYQPEIWSVCNAEPSNVKVLEAVSEESNGVWAVYTITTENGQETNLVEADFQMMENLQYASLWRDVNTVNVTNPLIEGDEMRDTTFLAKFRYNQTDYNKIFALNFEYVISNLHNR